MRRVPMSDERIVTGNYFLEKPRSRIGSAD